MALWAAGRIASEVTGETNVANDGCRKKITKNLTADRFSCKVMKNKFLGSFGKKTGSWYGGMDDYSLVVPDYDTDLEFTVKSRDGDKVRSGNFTEAFLVESNLRGNPFEVNTYETYTGGNYAYTTVVNRKNSSGPKVLLIRDSFSCAMMPFLALECSELTAIDLRYLKSISALEMAESGGYDAVVIAYNPTMFGTETFSFK